jgi:septal ring factor EnvC (AmiA/AmiB activator)
MFLMCCDVCTPQVDADRAKLHADTAAAHETTQEAAVALSEQEAALAAAKEQQEAYGRQLKSLAKERKQALEAKAKAEADVNEADAALTSGGRQRLPVMTPWPVRMRLSWRMRGCRHAVLMSCLGAF